MFLLSFDNKHSSRYVKSDKMNKQMHTHIHTHTERERERYKYI